MSSEELGINLFSHVLIIFRYYDNCDTDFGNFCCSVVSQTRNIVRQLHNEFSENTFAKLLKNVSKPLAAQLDMI